MASLLIIIKFLLSLTNGKVSIRIVDIDSLNKNQIKYIQDLVTWDVREEAMKEYSLLQLKSFQMMS